MADRTPEYKKAIDKIANKIKNGWGTPTEFRRQTQAPVANYTIMRLLDNSGDAVAAQTVILVAFFAGFSMPEIADLLKQMGDKTWPRILAGSTAPTIREKALLDAAQKITKKDPSMWGTIASNLELIARAAGVDVSDEIKKLG